MLAMRPTFHVVLLTVLAAALAACGSDKPGSDPQPATGGASKPAEVKLASNADAYLAHLKKLVDEAEAAGETTIDGKDGDVLLVKELRSLSVGPFWGDAAKTASRAPKDDRKDPLPAIVAYHKELQKAGIDWVFAPVPQKVAVDPSLVPGAPEVDGRIDVHCVAFYDELRKAGVPVLDLVPALQGMVKLGKRAHCRTDTHWTSEACELAAGLMAAHATQREWYAELPKTQHEVRSDTTEIAGDMASMRTAATPKETLTLRTVAGHRTSKDSPILLLGDSHCLIFQTGGDMLAESAGLASHLMHHLETPVDVLGVRGSGATPSRVDAFRGKRYDNKKFVVWCLTAREFTDGQGWAKVPVKR